MSPGRALAARLWYAQGAGLGVRLLAPLSSLFGAVVALRRAAFRAGLLRATRVPVPVVVVGSIVGTKLDEPTQAALFKALADADESR